MASDRNRGRHPGSPAWLLTTAVWCACTCGLPNYSENYDGGAGGGSTGGGSAGGSATGGGSTGGGSTGGGSAVGGGSAGGGATGGGSAGGGATGGGSAGGGATGGGSAGGGASDGGLPSCLTDGGGAPRDGGAQFSCAGGPSLFCSTFDAPGALGSFPSVFTQPATAAVGLSTCRYSTAPGSARFSGGSASGPSLAYVEYHSDAGAVGWKLGFDFYIEQISEGYLLATFDMASQPDLTVRIGVSAPVGQRLTLHANGDALDAGSLFQDNPVQTPTHKWQRIEAEYVPQAGPAPIAVRLDGQLWLSFTLPPLSNLASPNFKLGIPFQDPTTSGPSLVYVDNVRLERR